MAENVVISEDFRTMTVPLEQQVLGAMGDAWVRKVKFIVPRYCDGTDLSTYQFSVHFINNTVNEGYYPVPSITTNADTIEFDWLVSPVACANVGTTTASVSATDSDGETIAHRFSSTTYSFKVLPSNDTQDQSIIEQAGAMDVLVAGWRELVDDAIADAETAAANAQQVADTYAAELAKKANSDSHATDLTAGFADNLAATGEPVSAEFISRASGGDGAARIESVKGNTLVWNQLAHKESASTTNGVTITPQADGTFTISGTATDDDYFILGYISMVSGHKYLLKGCPAGGSASTYYYGIAGAATDTGSGGIQTGYTLNTSVRFLFKQGVTFDNVNTAFLCIDLTRMFGSGNEPATVAEFEALYPGAYYPYDAGTLLPVRVEGVETTDVDDNPLFVREIPASTYFPDGMKSAGTVRDELTATAAVKRVGAVDLGTLTWGAEGAWQQSKGMTRFNAALPNAATAPITDVENVKASAYFTPNLTVTGSTMSTAYCIAQHANGRVYLTMPYPEFNRASDLTAWLQDHPVTLYYQIQPTTTEIDPPLNLDYKVSDFGTERVQHTEPTAPVPMEIAYGIDAAATLASLPTDYISHESMARFIAAVEQHFGVTVTETWDETNKRYDYTIA